MNDLISREAAIEAVSDCGICIQRIVEVPAHGDLIDADDIPAYDSYEFPLGGKEMKPGEEGMIRIDDVVRILREVGRGYINECYECGDDALGRFTNALVEHLVRRIKSPEPEVKKCGE